MPEQLPSKRIYVGYSVVFATVVLSLLLWIAEMWRAGALHDNPWIYPAKVGSHGTLMLMCWAFILATRFRPVEWLFGGLDKVYRAHRVIGETAFFLIFLHPVFLAVARTDSLGGFFGYFWFSSDWTRNTGILALAFFTLLVVLSIYVKIAYHRWKRTHDFFGVLLVLILVHAWISGGEMRTYPVLTVWYGAWSALGLGAYVYIRFLYRFVGPQYDVVTSEVKDIGDAISEIRLKPVGRPLHHKPGQFIYISFDSDAVTEEPHPFSISSGPEDPALRLSIKRLGDWTRDIHKIERGEPARIWGPYGHFSDLALKEHAMPLLMIGGGVGITPFLSIIHSEVFAHRKGPAVLIYSVPNSAKQVYGQEIRAAAEKLPQLDTVMHLSDEQGFINEKFLRQSVSEPLEQHLVMLCGPGPMTDSIRNLLLKAGLQPKQIISEEFQIR